jgi:hypothetical protein
MIKTDDLPIITQPRQWELDAQKREDEEWIRFATGIRNAVLIVAVLYGAAYYFLVVR